MAKGFVVCAVLCALLHVLSAAVVPEKLSQKALVQQKYGHLQVEIDEWKRLGHPTTAHFMHRDGVVEIGHLIEMPKHVTLRDINYEEELTYYFYSRENTDGDIVAHDAASFKAAGWTPNRPTKFIIHGFANNIYSEMFDGLITAVLKNADVNVIAVDWGYLARPPNYLDARSHVPGVGRALAAMIDRLVADGGLDLDDLHLMGHSLGAHVAGCASKALESEGQIGRISGMDPAQPLFLVVQAERLDKNDAKLVDVIHSCGGWLGLAAALGDVDFYPNGGSFPQPGCYFPADMFGACSHGRSWQYMAESAVEDGAFAARECKTENDAKIGLCPEEAEGLMGLNLKWNPNGSGSYYLKTAKSAPFDLVAHARAYGQK